jgi:hypothetical protein
MSAMVVTIRENLVVRGALLGKLFGIVIGRGARCRNGINPDIGHLARKAYQPERRL